MVMIRVEIQDNLAIEEERLARVQRFKDLDGLSGDDYQYMLSEEQRISEKYQARVWRGSRNQFHLRDYSNARGKNENQINN